MQVFRVNALTSAASLTLVAAIFLGVGDPVVASTVPMAHVQPGAVVPSPDATAATDSPQLVAANRLMRATTTTTAAPVGPRPIAHQPMSTVAPNATAPTSEEPEAELAAEPAPAVAEPSSTVVPVSTTTAAPVDPQHAALVALAHSVTSWDFEAHGVKFVAGHAPEVPSSAWGAYAAATNTIYLSPPVLLSPGLAARYMAHELAHAYAARAMSPTERADLELFVASATGLPSEEALVDCIAMQWGQARGVYWRCVSGTEDPSVTVIS